jgi:hypothetical protein
VKQKSNGSWTRVGLTTVFLCIFAGMAYGFTCHEQSADCQIRNRDFRQIPSLRNKLKHLCSHSGSQEQGVWAANRRKNA